MNMSRLPAEDLDFLRQNNPFRSCAAQTEGKEPDFPGLHAQVKEKVQQLIQQQRDYPDRVLALRIMGAPGSGKTHLLQGFIHDYKQKSSNSTQKRIFIAHIPHCRSPQSTLAQLRREIMSQLVQETPKFSNTRKSHISNLIYALCGKLGIENAKNRVPKLSKIMDLEKTEDIDRSLLHCLVTYHQSQNRRDECRQWLQGHLRDPQFYTFPLTPIPEDPYEQEQQAWRVLIGLGNLLKICQIPLILCFDQLESISHDPKLIEAWETRLYLAEQMRSTLTMVFLIEEHWLKISKHLDPAYIQRLSCNVYHLHNCSRDESIEILRSRLESVAFPKKEKREQALKWLIEEFDHDAEDEFTLDDQSPRNVISLANKLIEHDVKAFPKTSIAQCLQQAFEEQCKEIAQNLQAFEEHDDYLLHALELSLRARAAELPQKEHRDKDNFRALSSGKTAFFICTVASPQTMNAALNRAQIWLKQRGSCHYIGEYGTMKETWVKTKEKMQAFEQQGGKIYLLQRDDLIRLYALHQLDCEIKACNVLHQGVALNSEALISHFNDLSFGVHLVDEVCGG